MVRLALIKEANTQFAGGHHEGAVCVFAGATSGIGLSTLDRVATMLYKSTFYILGRSAAKFANEIQKLNSLNTSCKFNFIEVDVSLLSEVDAACEQIASAGKKVDYLYMSAGLVPLNGAEYTKEGLERCFALSYYCRMRIIANLMPLLRQSTHPRVLSVLNGGKEKRMYDDDIALERRWGTTAVINHTTTMTSLAFDHLTKDDPKMTLLHSFPGLVKTDIFAKLTAPPTAGVVWSIMLAVIRGLVAIAMLILGMSREESGERQAFHLTSEMYAPGARRIDETSEEVSKVGIFEEYRDNGWSDKSWEHTVRTFDRVLATKQ